LSTQRDSYICVCVCIGGDCRIICVCIGGDYRIISVCVCVCIGGNCRIISVVCVCNWRWLQSHLCVCVYWRWLQNHLSVCLCVCNWRLKMDDFHDHPLASWIPKKNRGVIQPKFKGLRRLDDMSQLNQLRLERKGVNFSFLHLLFYSSLWWIEWCPPTLGSAIYFTGSTSSNANLIKNTFTDTFRNNIEPEHFVGELQHKLWKGWVVVLGFQERLFFPSIQGWARQVPLLLPSYNGFWISFPCVFILSLQEALIMCRNLPQSWWSLGL